MIDAVILGYARFSHVDDLHNDSDYLKIKDSDLPNEKVCRDLLKALPDEAKDEFREANKNILALKSQNEKPREIMLDFDDPACTVFGNQ